MDSQTTTLVIWFVQLVVVTLIAVAGHFLKKAASELKECFVTIAELRRKVLEIEVPTLKSRLDLLEHKVADLDKDVDELRLRDIAQKGKLPRFPKLSQREGEDT